MCRRWTDGDEHRMLAEGLIGLARPALERLLGSLRGKRHELLAPEPEEAVLAMLGYPPDGRDEWLHLAMDLRGEMLLDQGEVASAWAC